MRVFCAVVMLVAVACTPAPAPTPAPVPAPVVVEPGPSPLPVQVITGRVEDEPSCKATGGEWKPVCRMQKPACVTAFADAGKECSDGDDCLGNCVSPTGGEFATAGAKAKGICAVDDDPCGCRQTIEDGKATGAICVD